MPHRSSPLAVLVVSPCPSEATSAPSHEGLEALYDALEEQGDGLASEWLWPPTWDNLSGRLADPARAPVDVLCLQVSMSALPQGLGLLFEGPGGRAEPVSLRALASLAQSSALPLVIVRYAQPDGVESIPIGPALSELAALAHTHVLTVQDDIPPREIRLAIGAFLASLLAGRAVSAAWTDALSAAGLPADPEAGPAIVLYTPEPDAVISMPEPKLGKGVAKVIRFPQTGLSAGWRQLPELPQPAGLPAGPPQGFVGRDAQLVALERALRGESGTVWVRGHVGMGKTTLVAHAARWLVRTGRFSRVVYSSLTGGPLPETLLQDMGRALIGDSLALEGDSSSGSPQLPSQVDEALRETPTLIIWDNAESVLREGDAAYDAEAEMRFWAYARHLGSFEVSRLCIVSDTPTLPEQAASLAPMALAVPNLSRAESLALAHAFANAAGKRPLDAVTELAALVGGHPLALGVLTSLAPERSLGDIRADLEALMPSLRNGDSPLLNEMLDLALTYLLSRYDEALRGKLHALGVFAQGAMQPFLAALTQMSDEEWGRCQADLQAAHLMRAVPLAGFTIPYLQLHPALVRYLRRRLAGERREALERAYAQSHLGLLTWFSQSEDRARQAIAKLGHQQLPDLRHAMQLLLSSQELEMAANYARHLCRFLESIGLESERRHWMGRFEEAARRAIPAQGPLPRSAVRFLLSQSDSLVASGRVAEAGAVLKQLLERITPEGGLSYAGRDAAFDRGVAYHRFGRFLRATGRMDLVLQGYMQALQQLETAGADEEVRRETLALHEEVSDALATAMQVEAAERSCQRGLAIAEELGDRHAIGRLNARLGSVCMVRGDYDGARRHLEAALACFTEAQDPAQVAAVWDQLGDLARRQEDLAQAESNYLKSLDVARQSEQVLLQAQALARLAQVAETQGRLEDAEARYAEAIGLYQAHGAAPGMVAAQTALAEMLLRTGQAPRARVYAEAARASAEKIGPNVKPYSIHALLQRIAEAEGDGERAAHWRRRAQEAFAASPEFKAVLQQWQPLIRSVAVSCRGEALSLEAVEAVEKLERAEQWRKLALAIWGILGGQRDDALAADLDFVDALVVRAILEEINRPPEEQKSQS
ncbi:MAG: tetratricopeptide repeat protein [Chloroflexi bacterium]|nr:tetratricopeptide repeat protein [Chloroflexota bacterium]